MTNTLGEIKLQSKLDIFVTQRKWNLQRQRIIWLKYPFLGIHYIPFQSIPLIKQKNVLHTH